MVRGDGLQLWDNDGKRYLDGMSGLWCTNLGYGRQDLAAAASRQLEQLPYYNMFFHTTHPAVVELSEMLFSLLPDHYSHAIYTNSGSEANEVLIRTVRRYWQILGKPQKKIMIGRWNGYHGSTLGSTALGGMKFMHEMGGMLPDFAHIDEPYWYANGGELSPAEFGRRAALQLEEKILELGAENVAAFVAEPFQGAGGMIFPPQSYWPEIQRICRQYDVLLCADEVIGGFGRTGEWFAHEHFGFQPDTLSIAKGLTSGYIPMGGLVLGKRIAEVLVEQGGVFAHGLTYSGHPVAAAVAIANLRRCATRAWSRGSGGDRTLPATLPARGLRRPSAGRRGPGRRLRRRAAVRRGQGDPQALRQRERSGLALPHHRLRGGRDHPLHPRPHDHGPGAGGRACRDRRTDRQDPYRGGSHRARDRRALTRPVARPRPGRLRHGASP